MLNLDLTVNNINSSEGQASRPRIRNTQNLKQSSETDSAELCPNRETGFRFHLGRSGETVSRSVLSPILRGVLE